MNKGIINNIIKNSSVDGPGNRLVVFFQGCNLDCVYCHNPETINKCIHCGSCVEKCQSKALEIIEGKVVWTEELCTHCDKCIKTCAHNSSPKTKEYSSADLLKIIKRLKLFIRGVTFSGGECTLHKDFLLEIIPLIKNLGLDVYLDTNGYWDFDYMKDLVEVTDKFMLDIKSVDEKKHFEIMKNDNKKILRNLEILSKMDKLYEVRSVIIPKVLYNEDTVKKTLEIIKGKNIRYKLIKYRKYGVRSTCDYTSPTDEEMLYLKGICEAEGVEVVIV